MTALDLLPHNVRKALKARDPELREDLRAIPGAEADGWVVSFREGAWGHPAEFRKDDVLVWRARTGWKRARVTRQGRHMPAEVFPTLADALANNVTVLLGVRLT